MTALLAIDVGGHKKGCSGALFHDGRLGAVFLKLERGFQVYDMRVVIERPQQDGRSRAVPPSVLMDLCWTGALLAGEFRAHGATIVEYTPEQWKGTIQKAVHHARILDALLPEELWAVARGLNTTPASVLVEVAAAARKGALCRWRPDANGHYSRGSRTPDVLDAVGLGLFDLGRITKEGKRR